MNLNNLANFHLSLAGNKIDDTEVLKLSKQFNKIKGDTRIEIDFKQN